jgi:hypothetical protein
MIRYLENKYGLAAKDIVVTSFRPVQIVQGYHEMFAYIKGSDGHADEFMVKMSADWKKIEDNYYGLLIREELEQMAKDVFKQTCGVDVKTRVNFGDYFPPEVKADTSLEEVLLNGWLSYSQLIVFVREGDISQGIDFKTEAERFKIAWIATNPKVHNSQRIMLIPADIYDQLNKYNYGGLVFKPDSIVYLQDE